MTSPNWKFADKFAICSAGGWTGRLNPSQPNLGIEFLNGAGDVPADKLWNIWGVQASPKHSLDLEEACIREPDLITRFDQSEQDSFAFQLNYCLLPELPPGLIGVELWISVQTDDLHSHPELKISCRAPVGSPWEQLTVSRVRAEDSEGPSGSPVIGLVGRGSSATGQWFIDPSDLERSKFRSPAEDSAQELAIFGHFMEKGVIRRGRMRFLLADGPLEDPQLAELYRAFEQSPLPLTA